jgi:hypothetical protein
LAAILCTYNFYGEAIFTVRYAEQKGILNSAAVKDFLSVIQALYKEAALESKELEQWLASKDYQNWGQYMWVPYPSA